MATIDERIAETRAQIIAACEEAGLGECTLPNDNALWRKGQFWCGKANVEVGVRREYRSQPDDAAKVTVKVDGVSDYMRAVVYREPLKTEKIIAKIAEAQASHAKREAYWEQREKSSSEKRARSDANTAALAAVPHEGLRASADAAGLHLHDLTADQFAAAVAAIKGSE